MIYRKLLGLTNLILYAITQYGYIVNVYYKGAVRPFTVLSFTVDQELTTQGRNKVCKND